MARRLNAWAKFEPPARKFLTGFAVQHGRPPHYREVLAADGFWLLYAATKYHGGYTNVLKRLGYTPPRREYTSDDRRRNWDRFAADAAPVIADYVARLQRLPSQLELQSGGHSWISGAANAHHGGLVAVFEALGYQPQLPRLLSNWEVFAARVKPYLERATKTLGGTPSVNDLKELRLSWIATAAYKYHGGYDRARQSLGLPAPPHKLRGRGLANWNRFEQEFRPILQAAYNRLGRLPTTGELTKMGWQRYLFAARNSHGGYIAAARRWNLQASPNQTMQLRPRWCSRTRQWEALRQRFRFTIDMGIMPSCTRIHQVLPGLYAYWNRSGRSWMSVAKGFGLVDGASGRTMLTYWRVLNECLDFYQANGRWPKFREMSPSLSKLRTIHRTWPDFFGSFHLTPPLQAAVFDRHRQHYKWLLKHQPQTATPYIQMVNTIIIAHNHIAPPSPPSR